MISQKTILYRSAFADNKTFGRDKYGVRKKNEKQIKFYFPSHNILKKQGKCEISPDQKLFI